MKPSITKLTILFLLCSQINAFLPVNAQVSKKGTPKSFDNPVTDIKQIPVITMPELDSRDLLLEDSIRKISGDKTMRFAKSFQVNINLKEIGLPESVKNGKIWRLGIKSLKAYSINVIFSDYKLAKDAELYIYSSDKQSIIGAFTDENNQDFKSFATSPVKGNIIFIELFEPDNVEFSSHAVIGQINHDYKNIFKIFNLSKSYGQSGSCEINVNCPQGQLWQNEKKSVCKYIINGTYYDSGALINNTTFNGTPYFLTARHCFYAYLDWNAINTAANNSIFYFNYESPSCSNQDVTPQSISGSYLKAYWDPSDFLLIQLSSQPPQNYNAYYSGWDRRNINASSEVGIHHPMGDIKKISTSTNPVISTDKFSNTLDNLASFWRIIWTSGVTEEGSSGSPLFNQRKKIVGQLAGGYSACNSYNQGGHDFGPNQPDWYGKFSSSWAGGGTSTTQLSNWLDPCGAGVDTLEGNYCIQVQGNPYLTGMNPLCTTEGYTVNYQPLGSKLTWSWSSGNISKVSVGDPNPCYFQKYSNGNGYISVLIKKVCPGDINLSIPIHTGPYSSSDYPITGPSSAQCKSYVYYNIPSLSGVTSINWTWPGSWTYISGQNTAYLALRTGLSGSGGMVMVGVNNICGQSGSYASKYTTVYGNCYYSLIISPNPASEEVRITIPDITSSQSDSLIRLDQYTNITVSQKIYKVTISDKNGVICFNSNKDSKTFSIPIQNLINGNYIVSVFDGVTYYTAPLIIMHN